jgi:hypothetical protein
MAWLNKNWKWLAAVGIGALVVRLFLWPKRKAVRELKFEIDTEDAVANDFFIISGSAGGDQKGQISSGDE